MESDMRDGYAPNIMALTTDGWVARGDAVVFRHADAEDRWIDVTGAEAMDMVTRASLGLIDIGVTPGERVGIMARTRYEWTILDLALWSVGAIPIPIYDTSSRDQFDWITSDADIRRVFVGTAEHGELARAVAAERESPVEEVWVIDEGAIDELYKRGAGRDSSEVSDRSAAVGLDDMATIIYTSGTTGRPKGVVLTHFHFVRHTEALKVELHDVIYQEGASTVLFMTLAHSFARLIEVVFLATGVIVGYCPDTAKLVPLIGTFHPTLIVAVPRVFEKVYNAAEQRAQGSGKIKIFRWAAKQAIDYSRALDTPAGPGVLLSLRHGVAQRLVLNKILDVLGGRATWAVSGSAPLGERMGHFYRGLGITVLEGYGLTETTAASHVNRPGRAKIGTVGPPIPGLEVRFAEDGEILIRGDQIFSGYHRNPEATDEAMVDGWLATGDIGHADAEGYLTITGRKKEIIVTAGGKNVAPAVLEDRLRLYSLVGECVVVGDGRPFIGALITIDSEVLPKWLKGKGLPEMTIAEAAENPTVREHIDRAVERANKAVSRAESIRKYHIILEDFSIANGYLTPSLKVKRSRVLHDFADAIEALYVDTRPASE